MTRRVDSAPILTHRVLPTMFSGEHFLDGFDGPAVDHDETPGSLPGRDSCWWLKCVASRAPFVCLFVSFFPPAQGERTQRRHPPGGR